jgi:hypothetical protein
MDSLDGLSVQQPWLDMILRGVKTMEIRNFAVRTRGMVALHAPWKIDFAAAYFYGYAEPWKLPRHKVMAVADVADVWELNEQSWMSTLEQHRQPLPFVGGVYGARLENVRILNRPISCGGQPGLFRLPAWVTSRVLASVGA